MPIPRLALPGPGSAPDRSSPTQLLSAHAFPRSHHPSQPRTRRSRRGAPVRPQPSKAVQHRRVLVRERRHLVALRVAIQQRRHPAPPARRPRRDAHLALRRADLHQLDQQLPAALPADPNRHPRSAWLPRIPDIGPAPATPRPTLPLRLLVVLTLPTNHKQARYPPRSATSRRPAPSLPALLAMQSTHALRAPPPLPAPTIPTADSPHHPSQPRTRVRPAPRPTPHESRRRAPAPSDQRQPLAQASAAGAPRATDREPPPGRRPRTTTSRPPPRSHVNHPSYSLNQRITGRHRTSSLGHVTTPRAEAPTDIAVGPEVAKDVLDLGSTRGG